MYGVVFQDGYLPFGLGGGTHVAQPVRSSASDGYGRVVNSSRSAALDQDDRTERGGRSMGLRRTWIPPVLALAVALAGCGPKNGHASCHVAYPRLTADALDDRAD